MIRPTTPDDSAALIALAVAAEMLRANETEALKKVLADYFGGKLDDGHVWVTDEEEGKPCGVAYYAPDPMADRTWYLYMIAVRPDCQRRGRGTALIQHVENALRFACAIASLHARRAAVAGRDIGAAEVRSRAGVLHKVRLRGGGAHPRLLGGGR